MKFLKFGAALLLLASVVQGGQKPPEAKKRLAEMPDVQILNIQYLGSILPDAAGPLQSSKITALVRNNTMNRTIVGLLWKVEVINSRTQKVAEVIYPFTRSGAYYNKGFVIPAGASMEISFDLERKVHVDASKGVSVSIQNYVFREYDASRDKPEKVDFYASEDWPFKSKTEPVLEGTPENK